LLFYSASRLLKTTNHKAHTTKTTKKQKDFVLFIYEIITLNQTQKTMNYTTTQHHTTQQVLKYKDLYVTSKNKTFVLIYIQLVFACLLYLYYSV